MELRYWRCTTLWVGIGIIALAIGAGAMDPGLVGRRELRPELLEAGRGAAFPAPAGILLELEITPRNLDALKREPREGVEAEVRYLKLGKPQRSKVWVHLKGSKGSFQTIDKRPALTLEFEKGDSFFGLTKVHLNNSVEDPGYWNERLGAELFVQLGIPAARSGHASVTLNGRSLGLYVVKEGFERELFERFWEKPEGVVVEPKPGIENWWDRVDSKPLDGKPAGGAMPTLKFLAKAVEVSGGTKRWEALSKQIELDDFMTFAVLELWMGHRDGYCLAQNNFKWYWNAGMKRWWFVPHGMDQILGKVQIAEDARMVGPVAVAVLETVEGRRRYRERWGELMGKRLNPVKMERWIRKWVEELAPALSETNRRQVTEGGQLLIERIRERWKFLEERFNRTEAGVVRFSEPDGSALVMDWHRTGAEQANRLRERDRLGKKVWEMDAAPKLTTGWETNLRLAPGRYELEIQLEVEGLVAMKHGKFHGTRVRVIADGERSLGSSGAILASKSGEVVKVPFEVSGKREGETDVTVIWEVRAAEGTVRMVGVPKLRRAK